MAYPYTITTILAYVLIHRRIRYAATFQPWNSNYVISRKMEDGRWKTEDGRRIVLLCADTLRTSKGFRRFRKNESFRSEIRRKDARTPGRFAPSPERVANRGYASRDRAQEGKDRKSVV